MVAFFTFDFAFLAAASLDESSESEPESEPESDLTDTLFDNASPLRFLLPDVEAFSNTKQRVGCQTA